MARRPGEFQETAKDEVNRDAKGTPAAERVIDTERAPLREYAPRRGEPRASRPGDLFPTLTAAAAASSSRLRRSCPHAASISRPLLLRTCALIPFARNTPWNVSTSCALGRP